MDTTNPTTTTTWSFYKDNPTAWAAMVAACEAATTSIDLENFIFSPDDIGQQFIEVCARRAAAGVKVRFIWDAAGSFSFFGTAIIEDLRAKGIELVFFKTLLPSFFHFHNYRSWYFRNHRRTLVTDGVVGFTGSVSIAKRMLLWRDTSVRIEGPAVREMSLSFQRMWLRALGQKPPPTRDTPRVLPEANLSEFEYVTNVPLPGKREIYSRLLAAIRLAQKTIYITTPYFVPTHKLARVLRLAAHRGVDIRIILPANSDFPTVDLGARTYFHSLLKSGIRIYLYKDRMIHTKSVVIDNNWASVGTLNLDNISLLYNYEANIVTYNARFGQDLLNHFEEDLENARELTLEQWNRRFFVEKIATFFVKLVRGFL